VKLCAAVPLALVGGRCRRLHDRCARRRCHPITPPTAPAFPASSATSRRRSTRRPPRHDDRREQRNPSTTGQPVTFTAVVGSATTVPTGTVVFRTGQRRCAASLAAVGGKAQASCTTNALAAGAHAIAVSYGGSAAFAASAGSLAQTVAPPKLATTTKLSSSLNPSVAGQAVTFTAAVAAASGSPAGTVAFTDGTTTLCAAVKLVLSGTTMQAVQRRCFQTPPSPPFAGVRATPAVRRAWSDRHGAKVAAVATIASSLNPAVVGRAVTLTTSVSGGAGLASGTVTIKEGTKVVCTATVVVAGSSAKASCATSAFAVGSHPLVATYSGDTKYLAATSKTFTQVVTAK
jgi:hypothetical protein